MGRKRSYQIKVWVTEKEKERIETLSEKSKLNKSDYIRKCILDKDIIVVEGLKELTTELKRIGTNLNQITRAVNYGQVIDCREEIKTVYGEVRKLWQSLNAYLQRVR